VFRNSKEFYTEAEAADLLSISLSTLRRWRRSGTGPAWFRVGSILRYNQTALDEFIRTHTVEPSLT
jgi:excisionase family DNA binding protein